MSVEKTTVTLLRHQVLSLAQLVVYVVYDEAIASGQATSANLLLVTELSEALMWRLGSNTGTSTASGAEALLELKSCKVDIYTDGTRTAPAGFEKHKVHKDSTNLAIQLLHNHEVRASLNFITHGTLQLWAKCADFVLVYLTEHCTTLLRVHASSTVGQVCSFCASALDRTLHYLAQNACLFSCGPSVQILY